MENPRTTKIVSKYDVKGNRRHGRSNVRWKDRVRDYMEEEEGVVGWKESL